MCLDHVVGPSRHKWHKQATVFVKLRTSICILFHPLHINQLKITCCEWLSNVVWPSGIASVQKLPPLIQYLSHLFTSISRRSHTVDSYYACFDHVVACVGLQAVQVAQTSNSVCGNFHRWCLIRLRCQWIKGRDRRSKVGPVYRKTNQETRVAYHWITLYS